ncbi:MAG: helix-turn-helix transcriptional regulator [Gordonibacter sp.]|uniref:helix-turn-helix domain-containing protein n=1 Tax=Gordonibacter sp. TaxID=1968902 RepID=UPI002FC671F2
MQTYEALRQAARLGGLSLNKVSRALGKPESYISSAISRGSVPRCDTMARMADVCGYSLALLPRDKVPPDALVIDPPPREG